MKKTKIVREARPILGVQTQLMLFLMGMTAMILGLIWFMLTCFIQPRYNSFIRERLEVRVNTLVSMIDASEEPISSRDFWTLRLNTEFWESVNTAINDGTLDVSGCCVDISDTTLRTVNYIENVHPCLLHDSSSTLGGKGGTNSRDTMQAIRIRQKVFDTAEVNEILESSDVRQMILGRLSADGQYAVLVSANLAQVGAAVSVLGKLLPFILGITLLVGIVGSLVFSRWFTRPITQLSHAAREMSQGNYDVCIKSNSRNELGQLAHEFNHMAGEVKHSSQLQKDLLANVSHDLRTPLTLIKGYAETIRDLTGDNAEKRGEQLDIIVDETDRLSGLVNSVMELSKVSSGAQRPQLLEFDMSQLCFEVAGRYDGVCAQNHWTLQLEADQECMVWADPGMMERVLHNLLGNATHHIGADGVFVLRAIPHEGGGCRIEVEDHGPGIKREELPYLFDRYYRSRSDSGKTGTGLGLSITKAMLQGHGFRFGVNSTLGKGSTFWFEMTHCPPAELPGGH